MTVAAKKNLPKVVTLDHKWQLLFIAAIAGSQLITLATVLWSSVHFAHYVSAGTWAFQAVQFLYPVLFVAVAYLFVLHRISGFTARLFWAVFIATIGVAVYAALQFPTNFLFSAMHWYSTSSHPGWWQTFGLTWLPMAVALVMYSLVLFVVAKRSKK